MKRVLLLVLLLALQPCRAQGELLEHLRHEKIRGLSRSYRETLEHRRSPDELQDQEAMLRRYLSDLQKLTRAAAGTKERYQYDELRYNLNFQLERVRLERRLPRDLKIPDDGLYHLPDGQLWYQLYVHLNTGRDIDPAWLENFARQGMEHTQARLTALQQRLGYAGRDQEFDRHLHEPEFSLTDRQEVERLFHELGQRIQSRLSVDFDPVELPDFRIEPWPNSDKDTPPGEYDSNHRVFYYNFFQGRFPRRSLEFIYLHEADPGHHYQLSLEGKDRGHFWYPGFEEGWAAYAEDLGPDLGCYQDPYQEYGKWEYTLARYARLSLELGIHCHGWTKAQALDWWHEHVPFQPEIAEREVDRALSWPGQVLAYLMGEDDLLRLRAASGLEKRAFHRLVLHRGPLPEPVLEEVIKEATPGL